MICQGLENKYSKCTTHDCGALFLDFGMQIAVPNGCFLTCPELLFETSHIVMCRITCDVPQYMFPCPGDVFVGKEGSSLHEATSRVGNSIN